MFFKSKKCNSTEVKKLYKRMIMYFWIHGLGLPEKKRNFERKLSIFISFLFGIISFAQCIALYVRHGLSDRTGITNMSVVVSGLSILLIDRYVLFCQRKKLDGIVTNLIELCCKIPKQYTKNVQKGFILSFAFVDTYTVVLCIVNVCSILSETPYLEISANNRYLAVEIYGICYSAILWMQNSHFAAIYFCVTCSVTQKISQGLRDMFISGKIDSKCLVVMYSSITATARKLNDSFSLIISITSLYLLMAVFYQTYDAIFCYRFSIYRYILGFMTAINYFFCFLSICIFASSATTALSELKLLVDRLPVKLVKENKSFYLLSISDEFQGFRILDSVVVDKSLILSATGALLSYGVMIATLTATSVEKI